METPYDLLLDQYTNALSAIHDYMPDQLPIAILLWMTILARIIAHKRAPGIDSQSGWLENLIHRTDIKSWSQAREILRSFAWVDFIHGRPGEEAIELVVPHLEQVLQ